MLQVEWRCAENGDRLQMLVDGVEIAVTIGNEEPNQTLKLLRSLLNMNLYPDSPSRCRDLRTEGLCCPLYVAEPLRSGLRQQSARGGLAGCGLQSAGSHCGGSSGFL